jgi:glycosyltransferase involved in cell wall biosynthesis
LFPMHTVGGKIISQTLSFLRRLATRVPRRAETSSSQIIPEPLDFHSSQSSIRTLRLALYTTDNWDTASAHIRLVGASQHPDSGIKVLDGCQASKFPNLDFYINADAVVIQRDFPRHQEYYQAVIKWAHENNKPVIYEIDDVLFDLPEDHTEKEYYRLFEASIRAAIQSADAVITSTAPLADRLRQFNKHTWLLPNYLDDNIWDLKKPLGNLEKSDKPVSIGYMGGITRTHIYDLESIQNILYDVLMEYGKDVAFHFWGIAPKGMNDFPNVYIHEERFPDYREFARYFMGQPVDIWIAPLIDNAFNQCKSAIKYLEYSASKAPGIYSDVYPYREVIQANRNGYLASNEIEWKEALRRLIDDPSLRLEIGNAAFETISQLYKMSDHASEWGRTYRAAITSYYSKAAKGILDGVS